MNITHAKRDYRTVTYLHFDEELQLITNAKRDYLFFLRKAKRDYQTVNMHGDAVGEDKYKRKHPRASISDGKLRECLAGRPRVKCRARRYAP
jgi:hypothetical protein